MMRVIWNIVYLDKDFMELLRKKLIYIRPVLKTNYYMSSSYVISNNKKDLC